MKFLQIIKDRSILKNEIVNVFLFINLIIAFHNCAFWFKLNDVAHGPLVETLIFYINLARYHVVQSNAAMSLRFKSKYWSTENQTSMID